MDIRSRRLVMGLTLCLVAAGFGTRESVAGEQSGARKEKVRADAAGISGHELFLREWIANDPRSHGGDGLGPVFNDTSCVSCHNQGGVGGGGPEAKNVMVVTAFLANPAVAQPVPTRKRVAVPRQPEDAAPELDKKQAELDRQKQERKELLEELRKLHPGLAVSRSVVLHRSGTDPSYAAWRDQVLNLGNIFGNRVFQSVDEQNNGAGTEPGGFFGGLLQNVRRQKELELQPPAELQAEKVRGVAAIFAAVAFRGNAANGQRLVAIPSQRNATSLFGAGLIDSVPDEVLEAAAKKEYPEFPEISGRVARLKDGKIGRFGWKSQKASLYDFTMTACAVELGLNVPDQPQAGNPQAPDYRPAGFDLNQEECAALVKFLKDLPAPEQRDLDLPGVAEEIGAGSKLFATIGCAACHQAELGEARGMYSDLLLHDMGPENADSGSYGVFQPQSPGDDADDPLSGLVASSPETPFQSIFQPGAKQGNVEEKIPEKMLGAGRQEWRTPPLWGVRDSAPYLHDGRAKSLEQAIAFHGGEGQLSANRFFRLKAEERAQVLTFLRSLVAPGSDVAAK
jgi:CxxC motif-containing protein (DUF1111 family)